MYTLVRNVRNISATMTFVHKLQCQPQYKAGKQSNRAVTAAASAEG